MSDAGRPVDPFFAFLGKLLFPRQPNWERERNVKLLTIAIVFGFGIGLAIMVTICSLYFAKH